MAMAETGDFLLILAVLLAGIALLSFALLRGWEDWLQVRRLELGRSGARPRRSTATRRLELIDLKDRVRRLEAIADGVED
jgi:hypothetical protein